MAMAGHRVDLVCLPDEVKAINENFGTYFIRQSFEKGVKNFLTWQKSFLFKSIHIELFGERKYHLNVKKCQTVKQKKPLF